MTRKRNTLGCTCGINISTCWSPLFGSTFGARLCFLFFWGPRFQTAHTLGQPHPPRSLFTSFQAFIQDKSSKWIGDGPGTSSDGLVARAVQSGITSTSTSTSTDASPTSEETDAEDEGFAQVERMRELGLLG
jgi:hypothetical protein